eukprot:754507-Hanusia_phi.AAC.3
MVADGRELLGQLVQFSGLLVIAVGNGVQEVYRKVASQVAIIGPDHIAAPRHSEYCEMSANEMQETGEKSQDKAKAGNRNYRSSASCTHTRHGTTDECLRSTKKLSSTSNPLHEC